MNQEYSRIKNQIKEAEVKASKAGLYRLGYHLMPPTGWLNDPNGLCQFGDEYHLFFQYSPLDARGGMKAWGHYITKDFCHVTYAGAPLLPDMPFDKDGVYSGSCYTDKNGMHIFYTGNVKLEGEHDYILSGRLADTVLVESKDGISFNEKQVVIDTKDYPADYSCHIRDPKVWMENDIYYMILGGRTKKDEGNVLIYTSKDMKNWEMHKTLCADKTFGYMWECPDLFSLEEHYILSVSPQGLKKQEFKFQNIYQSGYFLVNENPVKEDVRFKTDTFVEWDMGFDFYAPQTFLDNKGRRILIGWAGMPDAEYENAEVKENWQHCFTVPRELTVKTDMLGNAYICQQPIEEILALHIGEEIPVLDGKFKEDLEYLDVICKDLPNEFHITIAKGVEFSYYNQVISLKLDKETGLGRNVRRIQIPKINKLQILVDASILEFYINDGETVFTTRYYKTDKGTDIRFQCEDAEIVVYPMQKTEVIKWEN